MKKMTTAAKYGAGAIGALAITFGATAAVGAQDDGADIDDSNTTVVEDDATEAREGRRGARQERRAERRENRQERRADIAEIIGISTEELVAAREDGQSLSEIAGDSIDEVVAYIIEQAEARLDIAVENGRITEERAAERLENIADRIEQRLAESVEDEQA